MRPLIYLVACTVDRFIAREDGSFDFFPFEGEHVADLLDFFPEMFPAPFRAAFGLDGVPNKLFDAVLMGRATYEVGLDIDLTNPYPHLEQYVFSRTMKTRPDPAIELVSGDALPAVRTLKRQPGKGIWLCGGAALATALFPEIDELILKVNPVLLGAGIPLFSGVVEYTHLELNSCRQYDNGFMLVRYSVKH